MTAYPQVALIERPCPADRPHLCWPGPTRFGYCCKPLPEEHMTAQPTREELLAENARLTAAIVEWHEARIAVMREAGSCPGEVSHATAMHRAKCMSKLDAIARAALAQREAAR